MRIVVEGGVSAPIQWTLIPVLLVLALPHLVSAQTFFSSEH